MSNNDPQPEQQIPPGNGNGNGDPHPQSLTITGISPIGGALAGGIDVTITGSGFQPGAEVFFGNVASPEVHVENSNQATAKVPPAAQTGTFPISVINPDGLSAELTSGFTYVSADQGEHAEVLGVEPLNVIEDTETQITIRGRNLIAAHENGLVALRGPARANISVSDFASSRDDATGLESLICTVRVIATPALAAEERMAIQVLAALRPGAQSDGVVESSREMFIVLAKTVPVTLAYTASIDPSKPNLVMVTGRNLNGCSLDVGANAIVHSQRSDDEYVAALVSYPADQPAPQLAVRAGGDGGEVARFEMSVATAATAKGEGEAAMAIAIDGNGGEPPDGGGGPGLTPVPGQQVVGPTAESSVVVNLNGQSLTSFNFDWSSFVVQFFRFRFRLRIANFVRVVPFFDGGGEEVGSPVVGKVGQLMNLRGMGILVALRVEITITISVSVILGYRFGLGFNPYNEFPQFGFGLGSIVVGFQFDFDIDIEIFFMTALILPDGSLKVLAVVDFNINLHFELSTDFRSLRFNNFKHKVNLRKIGPLSNLLPCDGRFQLAEDNGQTVFPDGFGGNQSFYFVRAPGRCCLSWNFDLELIRFTDDGPEAVFQPPFNVDYCLNALDSSNQNIPIVVSDQCPRGSLGFPGVEELTVGDPDKGEDDLRALMRPVDASGAFLPTESELQDVTDLGYHPYFYLADPDNPVCDSTGLFEGVAIATQPGSNTICVQLGDVDINVTETGPEAPSFWPGAVTGFSILSFLARGLAPALLFECEAPTTSVGLPVRVDQMAAPGTMTVSLTLAYYEGDELKEAKQGTSLSLERNEPFEAQREYVLAARIAANQVQLPQTIKVTSKNPRMSSPLAGIGFGNPREAANTPKQFFEGELVNDSTSGSSMTFEVTSGMIGKLVPIGPQDRNGARLKITPHNKEEGTNKFVPPGKAVKGSDTTVTIDFESQLTNGSNATVQLAKPSLTFVVSNDETFEEYLRVFQEVTDILNGPGSDGFFRGFDAAFYNELKSKGATAAILNEQGKKLWDHAWQNVGTLKDDRPLYWTRLRAIAALRAFAKRKTPPITGSALDDLIKHFEWPSRGLEPDGTLSLEASLMGSRVMVVTGFDPFSLPGEPEQSNPSGLIALQFQKATVGSGSAAVPVRTAIIPVRYRDFDAGLIETMLKTRLGSIFMLITCSQNGDQNYYDVERWAARNRVNGTDNENKRPQQLPVAPGHEFEQSTLPYDLVITSKRTLPGPQGDAPFVIDQSYRIAGETKDPSANRRNSSPNDKVDPGKFRPEPLPGEDAAFTKVSDVPDPTKESDIGSGGSYLSNEIFYRVCRLRNDFAPSLKSGHFHLPGTETDPRGTGPNLITGVAEALKDFVDKLASVQPKIISFQPTSVRPGGTVTIVGENFEGTTDVLVGFDSVQFRVLSSTQIEASISDDVSSGFISVVTPYGTAISNTRLIIIRRFRGDVGAELLAKRTELGLTNRAVAEQLGASTSTYRRWERGLDQPSARFHTPIAAFLGYDPNPNPQELGQLIREARERDGLTRSQLAERLNVSSSTVKAWETGLVSRPTPRVSGIFEDYLSEA